MATQAGYQIKDPAELSSLEEGDIARISGSDAIYRRDLAKEQEAMKTYSGGRGTKELDEAFNKFVYVGGSSGKVTSKASAAEIDVGLNAGEITPPATTADVLKETQVKNAARFSEAANTQLSVFEKQMEEANKRAEQAQKELDALEKRRETEVIDRYEEISQPFRAEMETAGNEKFKLEEKYERYSSLAASLATYAEDAYNDLQAAKARPGLTTLATGRYNNIAEDYNTKMTLTQTAMAALNNDIALGRTFIDRGIAAVEADKSDQLNYLNFVNDVINDKYSEVYTEFQIATQEEKDAISNQISVVTAELNRIDDEKDKVAEFLIGDNAYVALQAGVNLTDSYDEMVQKVANYYKQNPNQTFLQGLTSGQRAELEASGLTFDSSGGLVSSAGTISSTGKIGSYGLELLDTGGASAGNRSDRNNNPLNIKASDFTSKFKGVLGMENSPAADGGNFLVFDSPQSGFAAAQRLWKEGSSYKNVSVATALQRWSGGGYGADVAQQAGIDPNRDAQSLSDTELNSLFGAMAKREGYTGVGNSAVSGGEVVSYADFEAMFMQEAGQSFVSDAVKNEIIGDAYNEYLRALESQGVTTEPTPEFDLDLLSSTDKKKMYAQGLDYTNPTDVQTYLNNAYNKAEEEDKSEVDKLKEALGL